MRPPRVSSVPPPSRRLDRGLPQLVDQGVLLCSLPNPLTAAEQTRLRDARPPGAPEPLRVQRCVSCRGALVVAKHRIHVGSSTLDGR